MKSTRSARFAGRAPATRVAAAVFLIVGAFALMAQAPSPCGGGPGFVVTGQVTDAAGGGPLGGIPVQVGAVSFPAWGLVREDVTEPDGVYALHGPENDDVCYTFELVFNVANGLAPANPDFAAVVVPDVMACPGQTVTVDAALDPVP